MCRADLAGDGRRDNEGVAVDMMKENAAVCGGEKKRYKLGLGYDYIDRIRITLRLYG